MVYWVAAVFICFLGAGGEKRVGTKFRQTLNMQITGLI